MTRPKRTGILASLVAMTMVVGARAQSTGRLTPLRPTESAPEASRENVALSRSLRSRLGLGVATRLLRAANSSDRVRGAERAASDRTPEGLALLLRIATSGGQGNLDPRLPAEGVARADPKVLLATVRGLIAWSDQESARAALAALVAAPGGTFAARPASEPTDDPVGEEADGAARVYLARRHAALALAASGNGLAVEALAAMARGVGPGQGPSLDALAAYPPANPSVFGGVTLTTAPMVALAGRVADLRTLDAVLGVLPSSEPSLRAAALATLGAASDERVSAPARAALKDPDARVRVAACDALVRLGDPGAGPDVAELIQDSATVFAGLRLGEVAQDASIVRAAAARALASMDIDIRTAAVATLGRQRDGGAVLALAELAGDNALGQFAMLALARSPSAQAMAALEGLSGGRLGARFDRVVARAYFVRRFVRGERSASLDGLLHRFFSSSDPVDRAVGALAQVALGEAPLAGVLLDRDPRVRRAAAAGALARCNPSDLALLLRVREAEPDELTRIALSVGLLGGDPGEAIGGADLASSVAAGGVDAPLSALALAARWGDVEDERAPALLASLDPSVRAHAALGLSTSRSPRAVPFLARAYAFEGDDSVRRALVRALSKNAARAGASAEGFRALAFASRFEPDPTARAMAEHAIDSGPWVPSADALTPALPEAHDVAWLALTAARGDSIPAGMSGSLERSDGLSVPVVFDDDGVALVPGVPPGPSGVRLAPRLPAYSGEAR